MGVTIKVGKNHPFAQLNKKRDHFGQPHYGHGPEVPAGPIIGLDVSTMTGLVMLGPKGEQIYFTEVVLDPLKKGSTPTQRIERALKLGQIVFGYLEKDKPSMAVIEGYATHGKFINYGQFELGSAVRFACHKAKVPFYEVSPTALKKFASGKGAGDKSLIRLAVYKRWAFEHASDNVVDAYVLARVGLCLAGHVLPLAYESEVISKVCNQLHAY